MMALVADMNPNKLLSVPSQLPQKSMYSATIELMTGIRLVLTCVFPIEVLVVRNNAVEKFVVEGKVSQRSDHPTIS